MRQPHHVFDFLHLFQTFLCHHDVHDILQVAVGVIWCFNCEVPSVGRALKWYDSASFLFVCERKIRPERDPLPLLCPGFDSHQRPSYLCLSRFNRLSFAFCIFEHKQTSTLAPFNRLARCRVRYSSFRVPVTYVLTARCRVDSKRDLSAPVV